MSKKTEADILKDQIKYLTDLINNAQKCSMGASSTVSYAKNEYSSHNTREQYSKRYETQSTSKVHPGSSKSVYPKFHPSTKWSAHKTPVTNQNNYTSTSFSSKLPSSLIGHSAENDISKAKKVSGAVQAGFHTVTKVVNQTKLNKGKLESESSYSKYVWNKKQSENQKTKCNSSVQSLTEDRVEKTNENIVLSNTFPSQTKLVSKKSETKSLPMSNQLVVPKEVTLNSNAAKNLSVTAVQAQINVTESQRNKLKLEAIESDAHLENKYPPKKLISPQVLLKSKKVPDILISQAIVPRNSNVPETLLSQTVEQKSKDVPQIPQLTKLKYETLASGNSISNSVPLIDTRNASDQVIIDRNNSQSINNVTSSLIPVNSYDECTKISPLETSVQTTQLDRTAQNKARGDNFKAETAYVSQRSKSVQQSKAASIAELDTESVPKHGSQEPTEENSKPVLSMKSKAATIVEVNTELILKQSDPEPTLVTAKTGLSLKPSFLQPQMETTIHPTTLSLKPSFLKSHLSTRKKLDQEINPGKQEETVKCSTNSGSVISLRKATSSLGSSSEATSSVSSSRGTTASVSSLREATSTVIYPRVTTISVSSPKKDNSAAVNELSQQLLKAQTEILKMKRNITNQQITMKSIADIKKSKKQLKNSRSLSSFREHKTKFLKSSSEPVPSLLFSSSTLSSRLSPQKKFSLCSTSKGGYSSGNSSRGGYSSAHSGRGAYSFKTKYSFKKTADTTLLVGNRQITPSKTQTAAREIRSKYKIQKYKHVTPDHKAIRRRSRGSTEKKVFSKSRYKLIRSENSAHTKDHMPSTSSQHGTGGPRNVINKNRFKLVRSHTDVVQSGRKSNGHRQEHPYSHRKAYSWSSRGHSYARNGFYGYSHSTEYPKNRTIRHQRLHSHSSSYSSSRSFSHAGSQGHCLVRKQYALKRLQHLQKSSSFKLDRRRKTDTNVTKPQQTQFVSINGILYKSRANTSLVKSSPVMLKPSSLVVHKLSSERLKTVTVRGVSFSIDPTGKTLKRIVHSSEKQGSETRTADVKRVDIGGQTYIQTAHGTLERHGSIQTRHMASRMVQRSIVSARFRKNNAKRTVVKQYCMFYNRFGKCKRGETCRYIHDPDKVAVCTRFLRGTCQVEGCPFSHKISKDKMPMCSHFQRGMCSRDNCPYRHVKVNKNAAVCQDFIKGFCRLGDKCKKKHTLECPDFTANRTCAKGDKCPMVHKKSRKRKQTKHVTDQQTTNKEDKEKGCSDEDESGAVHKMRRLPTYISISGMEGSNHKSEAPQGTRGVQQSVLKIRPTLK